jgi:hypothetical protein
VRRSGFPFWNGAPFVGPQEVAERVFARIGKGELSDTFAVHPSQFVADGDTVVMLGTYTGTGSSGAPFEMKVAGTRWRRDRLMKALLARVRPVTPALTGPTVKGGQGAASYPSVRTTIVSG